MDPFYSIASAAAASADSESVTADESRADERRADRARAFKQRLSREATNTAVTAQTATGQPPATTKGSASRPTPLSFLSPALLRLQAQGYPIPLPDAGAPAQPEPQVEENPMIDTEEDTPQPQSREATTPLLAELSHREAKPAPEPVPSDPVASDAKATPPAEHNASPPESLTARPVDRDRDSRNRRDSQTGTKSQSAGSAPDPRFLIGPVSLPVPQDFTAAVAAPAAGRPLPSPEVMQQIVEFAAIHRGGDGTVEFHLGLVGAVLGGVRIKLSSFGNRRIGLSVKTGRGANPIGGEEIAGLIEALRQRDVEVVDVVLA